MQLESLHILLRVRQRAVDEASRQLAERITAETAATAAIRDQASEIDRQRRAAEAVSVSDHDVESFGAWFRVARGRLADLAAIHDRAVIETARARAELTAARTALEVVETLLRDAKRDGEIQAARAEQNEADDRAPRYGATEGLR